MPLTLGNTETISGDVTTLQWIKPGYEGDIERALGYHPGKLAQGYYILLLTRKPQPAEFEFSGTTLRSGGRAGLPAASDALDALRPKVHAEMQVKYGAAGYTDLQTNVLKTITIKGDQRICKVLPDLRHNPGMAPNDQYPMGGGGLQWTLKKPGIPFLVAVRVNANGTADMPMGVSVDLAKGGYEARAKLRQYMTRA